jgi:hypothetical protein
LACSLTACKSLSETAAEKAGEKIFEHATGGNIDIDGDTVTIKGDDGSNVTLGATEWPKDKIGKEIPELKDGTVTYVVNSDALCMIIVEKIKKNEYEDYLAKVKKAGFTHNEINYSDAALQSISADNGQGISFQLTYNAETEEINITVGKKEP